MSNANYERGRAREYRSMVYLEKAGFKAFRTAGSHGEFDVLGVSSTGFVLVQVKLNCRPSAAELETIRNFPAPPNAQKIIHIYTTGKHAPESITVGDV